MNIRVLQSANVEGIARQLLGKVLVTRIDGIVTSGLIVETEAYSFREKGCHAYQNKMTKRNKVMFAAGGIAYVYLCYGMHHMFNIVTNKADQADAVLIRALQPMEGTTVMLERTGSQSVKRLTSGPGKLCKALGINRELNGASLFGDAISLKEGEIIPDREVVTTTRIGIDYAEEDALLPWRFYIRGSEWVSKP